MRLPAAPLYILLPLLLLGGSCRSAYYATMEQFGVHKRDILVDRVEEGRADQAAAKEQFVTTLQAFKQLTDFDGGKLESVYASLKDEYEDSEAGAERVRDRIVSIEKVAGDLFEEWNGEIEGMTDAKLQGRSREMLDDTRNRYGTLIEKMRSASSKMDPVLEKFRNHVVFLKHNLNARAIDSLRETSLEIESEVDALIEGMQASIAEADAFIESMSSS
jgi:hypothetical protein